MTTAQIDDMYIGDPPACCQPAPLSDAEWNARGELLRAAHARALAEQPDRCPACGGSNITPTFLGRDEFECWASDCLAVWSQGR